MLRAGRKFRHARRFLCAVVFVAATCGTSTLMAADDCDEAFELAIAHFDPGHVVGLAYLSEETRFMSKALRLGRATACSAGDPHNPVYRENPAAAGPHLLRSLIICGDGTPDCAVARNASLVSCCDGIAAIESASMDRAGSANAVWQSLQLSGPSTGAEIMSQHCAAPIVEWLRAKGVTSISRYCAEAGAPTPGCWISLDFPTPCDLAFVATRLEADTAFGALFPGCRLVPYMAINRPGMPPGALRLGDRSSRQAIDVKRDREYAGFAGVVLIFRANSRPCRGPVDRERFGRACKVVVKNVGGLHEDEWQLIVESVSFIPGWSRPGDAE